MTARRAPARGHEQGFVLIGVVVMVLALTIIGISLYSLSGYESQFFGRTLDQRRALYRASGGVELVKYLVSQPLGSPAVSRLSSAALAVGREGVVSAVAWQDSPPDSSGPVVWSPDRPVHIRVGVNVNGTTHTVESQFVPTDQKNPYHYLFTVPGTLRYGDPGDDLSNRADVALRTRAGGTWQNIPPGDTAWKSRVEMPEGFVPTEVGSAPAPNSAAFITTHLAWATQATMTVSANPNTANVITLDAGGGHRFYRSPASDPNAPLAERQGWDFVSYKNLRVRVRGTVIWLVPAGIRMDAGVTFERLDRDDAATIVIVAGPNGRFPGQEAVGVSFLNGIEVFADQDERVNVFVVTHGAMQDKETSGGASDHNQANSICVFAQDYTMLPGLLIDPDNFMYRRYRSSMVGIADDLLERGLLPQPIGGIASGLTLVPGTWTESPGLQ